MGPRRKNEVLVLTCHREGKIGGVNGKGAGNGGARLCGDIAAKQSLPLVPKKGAGKLKRKVEVPATKSRPDLPKGFQQ